MVFIQHFRFIKRIIDKVLKHIVILVIYFYRYTISPFTGQNCRFYPSCSQYALESIEKNGVLNGSLSAFKRIIRCRPNVPGGYDPVLTDDVTIDKFNTDSPNNPATPKSA